MQISRFNPRSSCPSDSPLRRGSSILWSSFYRGRTPGCSCTSSPNLLRLQSLSPALHIHPRRKLESRITCILTRFLIDLFDSSIVGTLLNRCIAVTTAGGGGGAGPGGGAGARRGRPGGGLG